MNAPTSIAPVSPVTPERAPTVGFVSLGCPKALTDSELILTQLRAEGYETSKTYAGADLVIVNTCGFIDDAVKESLDTIGEALAANGKVIVTGCLGAKGGKDTGEGGSNLVRQVHPKVLAVTGPHATQEVMDAVHLHVPKPHDPFVDLVPAARDEFRGIAGIKLVNLGDYVKDGADIVNLDLAIHVGFSVVVFHEKSPFKKLRQVSMPCLPND